MFHARTKDIEVHYHYFHEPILVGDIKLQSIGANNELGRYFHRGIDKLQQFPVDLCLRTLDMTSSRGFTRANNENEVILRKPNEGDKIEGKLDEDIALDDNISIRAQCRIKR